MFEHSLSSLLLLLFAWAASGQQSVCDSYGYGPDTMTEQFGVDIPKTCLDVEIPGGSSTVNRCFYTYVPPSCATGGANTTPIPVVVILHGGESCPVVVAEENGWIEKAEEECFIAVFPEGHVAGDAPFNVFGNCWEIPGGINLPPAPIPNGPETSPCCCGDTDTPLSPQLDLIFLYEVIQTVVLSSDSVDPKRIYMTGHSNGCFAALAFVRTHSDVIAALSCTAAPAITPFASDYIATPQLSIRGELDTEVPYAGSYDANCEWCWIFPAAEASFQEALTANGCGDEVTPPTVVLVPQMDSDVLLGQMEHRKGQGCVAETELVTLNTAGHGIVNNAITDEVGGAQTTTVDITSLHWDFLSRFQSAQEPFDLGDDNDVPTPPPINNPPPTSPPINNPTPTSPPINDATPTSPPTNSMSGAPSGIFSTISTLALVIPVLFLVL